MIARLNGRLHEKNAGSLVLMAGGVGYEIFIPLSTFYEIPDPPAEVGLHIKTVVREDAIELFGFLTKEEKEAFLILNGISKIGPRLALNILSGIGPADLAKAISRKDVARLSTVPGVGKKTAERLILELKDKVAVLSGFSSPSKDEPTGPDEFTDLGQDVVSALMNLGYNRNEAGTAVAGALKENREEPQELSALLRLSLKRLQKS